MNKEELFTEVESFFKKQLDLDLTDVVVLRNNKFHLKMELTAISMGSMQLDLNQEEHGVMANFLEQVAKDNKVGA